jgi:hypothetical protein
MNFKVIDSISKTINRVIEKHKYLPNYLKIIHSQKNNKFSTSNIPKISINDYLNRIETYSEIEKNTLIIALIYIDKFCQMSNIILTPYNIHRILFCSILTSIKYNEDEIYEFKYYAKIAGISIKELKDLESEFLDSLNFSLYVDNNLFVQYQTYLYKLVEKS